MPSLRLGVSLQPRWPLHDGTAALRAAGHAEALGFDHVAVGNRLLDSGFDPRRPARVGRRPQRRRSASSTAVRRRLVRHRRGRRRPQDVRRRLREVAAGTGIAGTGAADRLTIASAEFLTPPGIPAAVPSPGRPLGGAAPTAASVADDLGRLAEAGLAACTLWLPIAAEHVEKAMEWIAAEVMPQLAH
jgi:hypothetical protein